MKICSRCQKTYADDNLNFCLEDGSVLSQMPSQVNQMAETLFVPPPRPTQPQPQMPSMPTAQPGWNQAQPQYAMQQPRKSSKTWIWVLLILGGLVLLCGGGALVLLFYIGSQVENVANSGNSSNSKSPGPGNRVTNTATPTSPSASGRTDLETIVLSEWVKENSDFGNTEMSGDEFLMSSKKKGFFRRSVSGLPPNCLPLSESLLHPAARPSAPALSRRREPCCGVAGGRHPARHGDRGHRRVLRSPEPSRPRPAPRRDPGVPRG